MPTARECGWFRAVMDSGHFGSGRGKRYSSLAGFELWSFVFYQINIFFELRNNNNNNNNNLLFVRQPPHWARAASCTRFLDHKQRRTTVGRNPLDEWSALRRDLYLTTYNTHNRQTSMSLAGFEPTVSACERPQTQALDSAASGTGNNNNNNNNNNNTWPNRLTVC